MRYTSYLYVQSSPTHIFQYNEIRRASGTLPPGYILNEAAVWSPRLKGDNGDIGQWLIPPRRVSKEKYDEDLDEYRCSNTLFQANHDFSQVKVIRDVGPLVQTRGFSSIKFVPFRENELVVLKTEEVGGTKAFMMVFDLDSKTVLMPETEIGPFKYEGIEFI